MTNEQRRVKEWMTKFGQETPKKPTALDYETAKLRATLNLEECLELITKGLGLRIDIKVDSTDYIIINEYNLNRVKLRYEKIKELDLVEVADAIADIAVVSLGTSVACGLDQEEFTQEILRSNDSKLWNGEEISKHYPSNLIHNVEITEVGTDSFLVKRADGKVIKAPGYSPANLKPILDKQSAEISN